jgi:hypothetical protein
MNDDASFSQVATVTKARTKEKIRPHTISHGGHGSGGAGGGLPVFPGSQADADADVTSPSPPEARFITSLGG